MDLPHPIVIKKKRHSLLMRWRIERVVRQVMAKETSHRDAFDAFRHTMGGTLPSGGGTPVVLAACNELYYWEFARTLIQSIERLGAPERVHLHLCEPSREALDDVAALAASLSAVALTFTFDDGSTAQQPAYPTIQYAAVRFLVAPMILASTSSTVLCLDVDGIAHRPVTSALADIAGQADVLLIRRPDEKSVRRVLASALAIQPGEAGIRFADRLGRAIAAILSLRPRYHVDQIAIVQISEAMEARGELATAQMPQSFADHDFAEDSVIWTAKSWQRKNSEAFMRAKSAVTGTLEAS
ncbi:hypothetical protein LQ948_18520 [Jiella sp. MQZ9-1]|uniref:Uncharacterized protein n=1 Tax=Jiella flava TaxID=2816857 RepID=A0A939G3S8_9HYPH|nr:hypothetical protein [Jiella flava]MBO0664544.1 hypothetical protein [Jiella flava]MCD2473190.1 hypothetical protein [Jiella flava]